MASNMNIDQAISSDMTNVVQDFKVDPMETDSGEQKPWTNSEWPKYWGFFNDVPDVKGAILLKSIWDVGKGWTADSGTTVTLDHISGWGKDSFDDVLFNVVTNMRIGGDGFAEIMREDNDDIKSKLINLKPLDPGRVDIFTNDEGRLDHYEYRRLKGGKAQRIEPMQMLHLANNRLADQVHGISDIKSLEDTFLASEELFKDGKKLMHHQVRPFIIWKLQTDKPAKIAELVAKIDKARNLGEDMFIPDDDDAIKFEIVQVNPSNFMIEWENLVRNRIYRTIILPQVMPGAGGKGTESSEKVVVFTFEQVVERDQRFIEKAIWNQLGLKIDLIHPASIKPDLQQDEAKDAGRGTEVAQPNDLTTGETI